LSQAERRVHPLAVHRAAAGISQRALAGMAKVDPKTVSNIERFHVEPSLRTACALAAVLGVDDVAELFPPEAS